MTILGEVRIVRRYFRISVALESLLWGMTALFVVLELGVAWNVLAPLSRELIHAWIAAAVVLAAAIVALFLWRGQFLASLSRIALWLEEQNPELRYAVVTAVEPEHSGLESVVEPLLNEINPVASARSIAVERILMPAATAAAAAIVFFALPPSWMAPRNGVAIGANGGSSIAALGNRLESVSARVISPAYTGIGEQRLSRPSTITAIQGSRVVISGDGPADGITARMVSASGVTAVLPIARNAADDRWSVSFAMADSTGGVLRLNDRRYARLVVVIPIVDEIPDARLILPERDTTVRAIPPSLPLAADITDDIGLRSAEFEYIISSGSEETFTFVHGTVAGRRVDGERRLRLTGTLPLSTLMLREDDRISVRAVAYDGNTLSGPGRGYSETRTIRVARKTEYDSVFVTPAMPSSDTAMMSLRMLILETERLEAQSAGMARPAFVAESRKLAGQSEQIRQRIQRIVDEQTMNGLLEPAPPLVTALNAMWDATRELDIGGTAEALPPLRIAYAALQSMRDEKRYYLRGGTRPIIVNTERVRLTGSDRGIAPARNARAIFSSDKDGLRHTYSAAIRLLHQSPDSAVALLALVRVQSISRYPDLASALGDAIDGISAGRDITASLLRARRVLEGTGTIVDSLPRWGGGW